MVNRLFLPQNFGTVVGTYEGLLPFCSPVHGVVVLCSGGGDTFDHYHVVIELFVLTGGGDS